MSDYPTLVKILQNNEAMKCDIWNRYSKKKWQLCETSHNCEI